MSLILWWEIINIYFLIIIKRISFSVILAGILRAGKKHFLGNLAVRFVCRMRSSHSACAQRIPLIFRGKTSAAFPDGSSTTYRFFYVNQTDSVLNFARGQIPADDTCVY